MYNRITWSALRSSGPNYRRNGLTVGKEQCLANAWHSPVALWPRTQTLTGGRRSRDISDIINGQACWGVRLEGQIKINLERATKLTLGDLHLDLQYVLGNAIDWHHFMRSDELHYVIILGSETDLVKGHTVACLKAPWGAANPLSFVRIPYVMHVGFFNFPVQGVSQP